MSVTAAGEFDEVYRSLAIPQQSITLFYGVRNEQGYWVGIYNSKAEAARVVDKGQKADRESVVALCEWEGQTIRDAIDIADDCARANIECECLSHPGGGYDLAKLNEAPEIESLVLQSVRYLVARGLATQEGSIVRFKA